MNFSAATQELLRRVLDATLMNWLEENTELIYSDQERNAIVIRTDRPASASRLLYGPLRDAAENGRLPFDTFIVEWRFRGKTHREGLALNFTPSRNQKTSK